MRMFTGIFTGYNLSGMRTPKADAWCIRTWQATRGGPERNYWVQGGRFCVIHTNSPMDYFEKSNALPERKADSSFASVEGQAVMQVIMQWRADD